MATEFKLSYTANEINTKLGKVDSLAEKSELPTKTSDLTNDSGFATENYVLCYAQPIGDYALNKDIPDVPVQSINGQTGDVNLTASDVGALPNTTVIPTVPQNVSAFTNDAGYLTEHQSLADYAKTADLGDLAAKDTVSKTDLASEVQATLNKADTALQSYTETDPTVPAWAKEANKPTYTASEVGALPNTTQIPSALADLTADATHQTVTDSEKSVWNAKANVSDIPTKVGSLINDSGYITSAEITSHNTNTGAHGDIRDLITGLTNRLNALADSDDTTLDQMSEIVTYIKSNKSLIEDITTNKINVSDIVNNLTTNITNKPLSAAQGVVIKSLIDNKLDSSTLGDAVDEALAQAKASGEFDGTSVTHSWSGTTLTVTSASGTSSADLKGAKGDSPVRGTDYWTEADKNEIKAYVDDAILNGAW
jgi:hypothetical protein